MKKIRIFSMIAAALILFAAVSPQKADAVTDAVVVNGQTVIFTILNNDLQELNYYTMPYISGGVMYVPYTDFSGHFGISSIYNSRDSILILSTSTNTIFFELGSKSAYDKSYNQLDFKAIIYNGQIYVPAQRTSEFFGLMYYYNSDRSVIRIKDFSSSYADRVVVTGFLSEMERRLKAYEEAARNDENTQTPEKKIVPFDLYLAFDGINEYTDTVIDKLLDKKIKAAFFVNSQDISKFPDVVRRIYVEGFTIGLRAGEELPETADELIETYRKGNEKLLNLLHAGTRIVNIPGSGRQEGFTAEYAEVIRSAGYRYWDYTMIPAETGTVLEKTDKIKDDSYDIRDNAVLELKCDDSSLELMRLYVDFCLENGCNISNITELTAPVNFRADKW